MSLKAMFTILLLLFGENVFWPEQPMVSAKVMADSNVKIFDNGVWWIQTSDDHPVQQKMTVLVNGVNKGATYALQFGHLVSGLGWPAIAVIYNTGYVRLTPPGQPFATSFILGPAYWDSSNNYFHNIQISRIEIDTSSANPYGALRLTIFARDYGASIWPAYRLDITYQITLLEPERSATSMAVSTTYQVANSFALSERRQASHEGFKWVQFSSMYIDNTYHDSDSVRYVDVNGVLRGADFADVGCNAVVFSSPTPLSGTNRWILVRHQDNAGWQGNTPNTFVLVNNTTVASTIIPQGYVACTTDPNDDNVGVWLNDETAPLSFSQGDSGRIAFTLIAKDNPIASQTFSSQALYDGWLLEGMESSNTGGAKNFSGITIYIGDDAADRQYRAIVSFDTSALPADVLLTKVVLKIKLQGVVGISPFSTHGNLLIDVRKGAFSGNAGLQVSDFQATASKNNVGFIPPKSIDGWYTKTWTNGIFPYINRTGLSQFRLRFAKDDNDDMNADFLKFFSGNAAAGYRPQLIVEYSVP
jgi:hypothetical protein